MVNHMQMMTLREVADFLRFNEATVCRLAAEGKLPGVKVGKSWRFNLIAVESLFTRIQFEMIAGSRENTDKPKD
jgi:excisionase family DNA binding protein